MRIAWAALILVMLSEFAPSAGRISLQFFVLTDCPISNAYAPEIQRICNTYAARGISCTLVYEDSKVQNTAVRQHMREYGYSATMHAVVDADRSLAARVKATVTPEAALIDASGKLRYRGRIDNFYASLGVTRRHVTEHNLTDALDAVLAGKPVATTETKPLGCYIVPANL
jgi:hypothetical protein